MITTVQHKVLEDKQFKNKYRGTLDVERTENTKNITKQVLFLERKESLREHIRC